MKVLWIVLGVLGALCLLCGGGMFFLFSKGKGMWDEAVVYGNTSAQAIGSNWSAEELEKRGPSILKDNGHDKVQGLMQLYQDKLGVVKGTPAGHLTSFNGSNNNGVSEINADWTSEAQFEKGSGTIDIHLLKRGESWEITDFTVHSDALNK